MEPWILCILGNYLLRNIYHIYLLSQKIYELVYRIKFNLIFLQVKMG